jgi:Domain of unknown function (DUF4105)
MNQTFIKPILFTCCLLFSFFHLSAQGLPPLSPQAQISLITVSPGEELYSMYGHSAIRVNDPGQGIDYVFNYGTFDFNTPNFYVKFVRGKLPYQLSVGYFEDLQRHSIRDNRSVVEQVLNLSAAEKQKVVYFLEDNYRPENRSYLYDFFFDNCATRIRDVFQKGLGEALQFRKTPDPDARTFRQLVGIYQQPHPWADLGVDLAMGLPADAEASPWQTMFLPDYLMTQFQLARVNRSATDAPAGQKGWQPFVKETRQIFKAQPRPVAASLQRPTVIFWVLLASMAAFTYYQIKNRHINYSADIVLFGLTGLLGLLVLFLWFGTDHKAFADNLNFLWACPLHLPFAFLLLRKNKPAGVRIYFACMVVLAVLIVVTWFIFPQEFHQAVFPIVLLLALRAWYVARTSQFSPRTPNPYK